MMLLGLYPLNDSPCTLLTLLLLRLISTRGQEPGRVGGFPRYSTTTRYAALRLEHLTDLLSKRLSTILRGPSRQAVPGDAYLLFLGLISMTVTAHRHQIENIDVYSTYGSHVRRSCQRLVHAEER